MKSGVNREYQILPLLIASIFLLLSCSKSKEPVRVDSAVGDKAAVTLDARGNSDSEVTVEQLAPTRAPIESAAQSQDSGSRTSAEDSDGTASTAAPILTEQTTSCPAGLQARLASGYASSLTPGANLAGCDLSGLDLSHVDLSGADLTNAMFKHTRLDNTSLSNAKLAGANLLDAMILGAVDFSGADLTGAAIGLRDRAHLAMLSEASSLEDVLWRIRILYHEDLTQLFPDLTGLVNPFGSKSISPAGEHVENMTIAANLERHGWSRWSHDSEWYWHPFRLDWHPQSSHLALITGEDALPPHLWKEITIMNVQSGEESQLGADFVMPSGPSWSNEGDHIAVVDDYGLLPFLPIPLADDYGVPPFMPLSVLQVWSFPSLERTATITFAGEHLGDPLWTGDQNEVAVLAVGATNRVGVIVFDITTGQGVKAVETDFLAVNDAAWSPDGQWLAIATASSTYRLGENGVVLFDGHTLQERIILPLAETLFDGEDNVVFRDVSWSAGRDYLIIRDSLGGWIFWPTNRLAPL